MRSACSAPDPRGMPAIVRRRQSAPDVEVRAPRERRVADQFGFSNAAFSEMGADEAINRAVPIAPHHIGYAGRVRASGCSHFGCALHAAIARRAFLDPAAYRRDLVGRQWRPAQRHVRRHLAGDALHQETAVPRRPA